MHECFLFICFWVLNTRFLKVICRAPQRTRSIFQRTQWRTSKNPGRCLDQETKKNGAKKDTAKKEWRNSAPHQERHIGVKIEKCPRRWGPRTSMYPPHPRLHLVKVNVHHWAAKIQRYVRCIDLCVCLCGVRPFFNFFHLVLFCFSFHRWIHPSTMFT